MRLTRAIDSWLTLGASSGIGIANTPVTAQSGYTGRLDRSTTGTVTKIRTGANIPVTFIQRGKNVHDVTPLSLSYTDKAETKDVNLTTNAETITAVIISTTSQQAEARITEVVVQNISLPIENGTINWQYALPGDPGSTGTYQVVLKVKMPDNRTHDPRKEQLIINGTIVNITQQEVQDYIKLERESDEVEYAAGYIDLGIQSNVDNYTISIVECDNAIPLTLVPTTVEMDYMGNPVTVKVIDENNKGWRFS